MRYIMVWGQPWEGRKLVKSYFKAQDEHGGSCPLSAIPEAQVGGLQFKASLDINSEIKTTKN
jgi:hypothetical protein